MKQFFFIIALFVSLVSIGQTDEYYRSVDWKFYPDSIVQLTDSTYQLVALPFDYNDPGAINRIIGNYVVDFVGHRYKVIDSTATKLTVWDTYQTGQAPQTGQIARCYRSVGTGEAEFIGSVDYSPLDESARWKLNGSDNELLWRIKPKSITFKNDSIELALWSGDTIKSLFPSSLNDSLFYLQLGDSVALINRLDTLNIYLTGAPTNITVSSPLAKSGNNISLSYDTNTLAVASNALKVKDNTFQPLSSILTNTTASFTTALETKLNEIEDGAEVNVNADWDASSGDAQILNKPTLLSQFTNDLGNYGGFLTTETDPIFASDSAKILHWSDTLNLTKGIASQYDLTTGLATKQNTLTTGNLTENIIGLQFDNTRQVIGGSAQLSLTSGYFIPTTTEQTNWNTAYTDRNKWDGGTTGLVASTGRTSLGGTTIGQNVFTSTNPSAIRFLRANADNTVSWLDAATFRAAIGVTNYSLPLATNGTRGGIQIGYTSTANNFALQLSSEKAYTALPDATTSTKGIASFNSGNFSVSSGAVSITTGGVSAANLSNSVISGQVDIAADIVDTDEFLISDGATLKRTDASRLKTFIGAGFADPMTTVGDIIYRNQSNVTTRLPIGTRDYVLKSYMGTLSWQPVMSGITSGAIPFNNGSGSLNNDGVAFTYNSSTNTLDVDNVTVDSETYGIGWSGDNSVPTKSDLYTKIESWTTNYVPTVRTLTINGTTYDLSANRSWTVSASPAGSNTQVQYNNMGVLGASSSFTFNPGTGVVTASNFQLGSDRRYKIKIRKLSDLKWVDDIQFVSFRMKQDKKVERYGVIAQQVEKVNPNLVSENADGLKSVSYTDLLIAKVARQDEQIKELTERLEQLEKLLTK